MYCNKNFSTFNLIWWGFFTRIILEQSPETRAYFVKTVYYSTARCQPSNRRRFFQLSADGKRAKARFPLTYFAVAGEKFRCRKFF